jgi:hypothetical protein
MEPNMCAGNCGLNLNDFDDEWDYQCDGCDEHFCDNCFQEFGKSFEELSIKDEDDPDYDEFHWYCANCQKA